MFRIGHCFATDESSRIPGPIVRSPRFGGLEGEVALFPHGHILRMLAAR
jgi:hypothetical protein